MVAQRIDNKKTKCESFYDVPANLAVNEEEWEHNDEQEQHDVNCRMVEMDLHRRFYDMHNNERHVLTDQQKGVLDAMQFQCAQRRWECLYDRAKHHRLRDTCIEQLSSYSWVP
jgi:hypothetical protein